MKARSLLCAALLASLAAPVLAADDPAYVGRGIEAQATSPDYQVVVGSTVFKMSDAERELAEQLAEELLADTFIKGRIEVLVLNGEAYLSGEVNSVGQIYRAVEITKRHVALDRININDLNS